MDKKILENKIEISKWENLEGLKNKFFSMIVFSARRSGKTELIKWLYSKLDFGKEYDHVVVISESQDTLDNFSSIVHGALFFDRYDGEILMKLISMSEKLETEGRKHSFLVIIDDVVGNNIKASEAIAKVYAIGRHYQISVILISQRLTLINCTVRSNSDVILIGRLKSAQERESVIENMINGVADEKELLALGYTKEKQFYRDLIKQYTSDYQFLVLDYIDNNNNSFDSIVHWTKADIIEK